MRQQDFEPALFRRLQTATRSARLPAVKTLADFDFSFQPSVKREQIESLHTLGFIERKENVVLLGPESEVPFESRASGRTRFRPPHTPSRRRIRAGAPRRGWYPR